MACGRIQSATGTKDKKNETSTWCGCIDDFGQEEESDAARHKPGNDLVQMGQGAAWCPDLQIR